MRQHARREELVAEFHLRVESGVLSRMDVIQLASAWNLPIVTQESSNGDSLVMVDGRPYTFTPSGVLVQGV